MTTRWNCKCVVLDVDDTLYLERDYVRSGFEAVGNWAQSELGMQDVGKRAWELFVAGERGDIFNQVLEGSDLEPADAIPRMVSVYRSHQPEIELLSDAKECIEAIRTSVRLAALTDGPAVSQRNKVSALGVDAYCDPVVVTAELGQGKGKPDPAGFRLIMERLGLQGVDCVYVADNPKKDFIAPAALGWHRLRVRRPQGLHYDAASNDDVELECPDLSDLPAILGVRC